MSPHRSTKTPDTDEITVVDPIIHKNNRPPQPGYLNIILTVIQGSDIDFGRTYHLNEKTVCLGRDKGNTIQVDDMKVSKIHCEITPIKTDALEQIVITDLKSTNGTYVNGEPIEQRILTTGDKITIGDTVLRFSYHDEIEEEYHVRLFNFAATDSLTGLYNRRYILNELENQRKIAKRNKRIFSIVIIDIDDFKVINDSFGHQAGDEYLKKVAFEINHSLREQDIPGRLGGEEFLIILPETGLEGATYLADRIRKQIQASSIIYQNNAISATISAGVCQYRGKTQTTNSLFQQADHALYEAKKAGKNQVVSSPINADSETDVDTHPE